MDRIVVRGDRSVDPYDAFFSNFLASFLKSPAGATTVTGTLSPLEDELMRRDMR